MGSFQSGFQMGQTAYQQAIRNDEAQRELKMREAADARAAEEHGLRMSGLRRVEDATANLNRVVGVGIQNPAAVKANDADFDAAVAATGQGLPMPKAAPMQPEWRPATALEINAAQSGLAAAKGDMQGMEVLRVGRKGMEFDEGYKKHRGDWDAMDDDTKLKLVDKLSMDTNIRGNGTWVPGSGKKSGYMYWTPPGKDPIKLSANEARELYALGSLVDVDPTRARAEMDKVSDRVRNIAKEVFDMQVKGVQTNNTAEHYARADENDAARTGIAKQQADQTGAYYRGLIDARNKAEGQSKASSEFENQINGVLEGYQAAIAVGPKGAQAAAAYAREYDQLRATAAQRGLKVPPTLSSLTASQKGQGLEKPVKVEDAGQAYRVGGELKYTDGRGGFIAEGGLLPQDRASFLAKHGVPDNLIGQLPWNEDGTAVLFRNQRYSSADPRDMAQLVADYKRLGANDIAVDEAQRGSLGIHRATQTARDRFNQPQPTNSSGFGPKITYRADPRAPSIYATPDEWDAYRAMQAQSR